ncbi:hypothetical protein Ddc_05743 [Ditylenchus destructor]|nr:hypothetical protein Ddc_05743 [Ditylenchus destructor]
MTNISDDFRSLTAVKVNTHYVGIKPRFSPQLPSVSPHSGWWIANESSTELFSLRLLVCQRRLSREISDTDSDDGTPNPQCNPHN